MSKKNGLMFIILSISFFFSVSVLADTRVISGFVKDENGVGVAGVLVIASDDACSGKYFKSSGASQDDGAFEIVLDDNEPLVPRNVFLTAKSPENSFYYNTYKNGDTGSALCSDAKAIEVPDNGIDNVIVPVNLGGRITGKVLNNNLPIEGINVILTTGCPESNHIIAVSSRTNAEGEYSVVVPAGAFIPYVKPSDENLPYLTQFWNDTDAGAESCDEAKLASVSKNQEVSNVNFNLVVGGTIKGNVKDYAGQPVKNGVIYFSYDKCGNSYITEVNTDENGDYVKNGLPINKDIYINSRSKTINPYYIDKAWSSAGSESNCQRAEAISLNGGEERAGVDLTLDLGGIISGTVKDSFGNPISGVIVQAYSEEPCVSGTGIWLSDDVTDNEGNFKVQSVPTGNVYLSAIVTDERVKDSKYFKSSYWNGVNGSSTCTDTVAFNVEPSTTHTNINFILDTLGIVKGKILESNGSGVNGLIVQAYANKCDFIPIYDSYTTGDGSFTFSEVKGVDTIYLRVIDPNETRLWIDGWYADYAKVVYQCNQAKSVQVIIKGENNNNLIYIESIKEYSYGNVNNAKLISMNAVKKSKKGKLKKKKAKSMGKEIKTYMDNLLNYNIQVARVSNIKKQVDVAMKKNKLKKWKKVDNSLKNLLNKIKK